MSDPEGLSSAEISKQYETWRNNEGKKLINGAEPDSQPRAGKITASQEIYVGPDGHQATPQQIAGMSAPEAAKYHLAGREVTVTKLQQTEGQPPYEVEETTEERYTKEDLYPLNTGEGVIRYLWDHYGEHPNIRNWAERYYNKELTYDNLINIKNELDERYPEGYVNRSY